MRTFFGNSSSIVLGVSLGSPVPLTISYFLLQLSAWLGLNNADSIAEAIVASAQPQFVVARMILAICTVYATTFMVANLALSHKRLIAIVAALPIIFIALFATFRVRPETSFWIDSFSAQAIGLQAATIVALVCLVIAYLLAAWAGSNRGVQTTNIVVSQWAQKPWTQKPTYFYSIILLMVLYHLLLWWDYKMGPIIYMDINILSIVYCSILVGAVVNFIWGMKGKNESTPLSSHWNS